MTNFGAQSKATALPKANTLSDTGLFIIDDQKLNLEMESQLTRLMEEAEDETPHAELVKQLKRLSKSVERMVDQLERREENSGSEQH